MLTVLQSRVLWLIYPVILVVFVSCGASDSASSTDTFTNFLKAADIPAIGAGSTSRTTSLGGEWCRILNTELRLYVQEPGSYFCQFAAIETQDSRLTFPSSGYSYFKLTLAAQGNTRLLRMGADSGVQTVHICAIPSATDPLPAPTSEVVLKVQTATNASGVPEKKLRVESSYGSYVHVIDLTADVNFASTGVTYQAHDAYNSEAFSSRGSMAVGTPNKVGNYFKLGSANPQTLYCEFDTAEGASALSDNGAAGVVESWANTAALECVNPSSSGRYYATAGDPARLAEQTAPDPTLALSDAWDCTTPSGIEFADITPTDASTLEAISACFLASAAQAPPGGSVCP